MPYSRLLPFLTIFIICQILVIKASGQHSEDTLHSDSTTKLENVIVSTNGGSYRMEADKMIFKADAALTAKGGTADAIFRQIPGIVISPSGTLTLRGATPTILIDGKRTNLTLEQIPAGQIESVEIITNPSAKYDANGNGVVNIIMKKVRKPGWNASLSANWTSIPEKTVIADLNYGYNKWNFNFNYFQHWHQSKWKEYIDRQNEDGSFISQHNLAKQFGIFRKAKLTIGLHLNNWNDFTFGGDWGGVLQSLSETRDIGYKYNNPDMDASAMRRTDGKEPFHFGHINFEHTLRLHKNGEKVVTTFSFETYHGPEYGRYALDQYNESNQYTGSSLQSYNGGIHAHTIILQSDYSNPLRDGKAKLESGYKISWHKDHNQNLMYDFTDMNLSTAQLNTNASYDFHYSDPTYAGYSTYSDRYGWFGYQAGLRFEQYEYTGVMPDSALYIHYHNTGLYPSLFLQAFLNNENQIHLNYSRRVNRPGFDELTPRTNYSDPQNLQRGNPKLQSEFTNLMELAFSHHKGSTTFLSTLYFRNVQHAITTFTTSLAPDTLLTQYINGKHQNSYGFELTYKSKVYSWWNITANLNGFHTSIVANNLNTNIVNKGYSWFAKFGSDFGLPNDYALQLNGVYRSPEILAQGKTTSTGSVDLSLKKSFLKTKSLTMILSGIDLLNTDRNWQRTTISNQFNQMDKQKYKTRQIKITLTYDIGQ